MQRARKGRDRLTSDLRRGACPGGAKGLERLTRCLQIGPSCRICDPPWQGPDVLSRASLDAGKRLAQRVKTHRAQAERLGVKVLEAEGSSGPCHGILPGL